MEIGFERLERYGYKKEEIRARAMSNAEIHMYIAQELIKTGKRNSEIRIVNMTTGDVYIFLGVEDFIMDDCNMAYELELISIRETRIWRTADKEETRIVVLIREILEESGK